MKMATTRLMPLHSGKGRTVAEALGRVTDYVENPEKTNGGDLVTAYQCNPSIADQEFLFSKRQYAAITGRERKDNDVIAYHLRQSFKPGEITPELAEGKGKGYERWAKTFNLKEMAKTLIYLQENELTDLGELEKACDAAVQKFNDLADQTKAASARMKGISELQRHIGAYGKTQEIYEQYRKLTGRKREKFYEQHSSEITACQAAKRYFDSLGLKKLPSMQSLKQEYAMLQVENKNRYSEYKQAREKMIELLTAKNNVERILGVTEKEKNRSRQQEVR